MATIMHINYCEQGQTLEQACRLAGRIGFDGIEFRSRPSGDLSLEEYLDRIAAEYEKQGLSEIHFGGGVSLDDPDPARQAANIDGFLDFYRAASKRFTLTVCNLQTDWIEDKEQAYDEYELHGSALLTDEQWNRQVDGLKQVASFAEEHGFRFALETHHCYPHDLPEASRTLVDAVGSPALGVLFDYGNIIGFSPCPPVKECIATLGYSITYLHLKNSLSTGTRFRQRCALSEGEINNRELLQELKDMGYRGNICLESPRKGDRQAFARADYDYLETILAELE